MTNEKERLSDFFKKSEEDIEGLKNVQFNLYQLSFLGKQEDWRKLNDYPLAISEDIDDEYLERIGANNKHGFLYSETKGFIFEKEGDGDILRYIRFVGMHDNDGKEFYVDTPKLDCFYLETIPQKEKD